MEIEKNKINFAHQLNNVYKDLTDRELFERQTFYQFQVSKNLSHIKSILVFLLVLVILNLLGIIWFTIQNS